MNKKKVISFSILISTIIFTFFYYELDTYLSLEYIKSQQKNFHEIYQANPWKTVSIYLTVYVLTTASSFPGATVLTLLGGALFGFLHATILVSIGSTTGATIAFLLSRYYFRTWVQNKFTKQYEKFNAGIAREGAFYLFSLRLIPVVPFFVINLVMGLTQIKVSTYYTVSLFSMLPATLVYVNAGTQLAQIESIQGIFSAKLILSFALLGLFPWLLKFIFKILGKSFRI